ncbi:3-oxoacyl-ACP synthase III family protein [Maledivibacter halophilus]|uniref:3-oxoacyl-[acyl-carrier-protein] synthase-3 n=1 Tax=Maledivibacter halophilus TaxID=36842 RepID=A0A1T5LKB1_9FIRM|nr:3-oxoacyl-[acyl-carrier-protein] synthase III C-terminal domain-containing protein [Maledivibacter halophilus]SKC76386.1 3-oxoacyl-[acyl-carrier-protein] synthase-3 [Maledivibacter halophilus]
MGIYQGIGIASTASYSPEKIIRVEDIKKEYGFTDEYCKRIGIEQLHAAEDEYPTDMAVKAAKQAIIKADIDPEEIDLVLYSYGAFPEYFVWPEFAKIQYELGAKNATALRIDQGCNAQIISLEYACAKIKANPHINNVLIVSADVFIEPIINRWTNADACFFGDGASAAIVKRGVRDNRIVGIRNMTDGELNYLWKIPVGGTKEPLESKHIGENLFRIDMNKLAMEYLKDDEKRKAVAKRMVNTNLQTLNKLLRKVNKKKNQIDKMIVYNVGKYIIENICQAMEIEINQTSWNITKKYAHMGPVDIFFNLDKMLQKGQINCGELVILFSAGTGFSTASAAIEF